MTDRFVDIHGNLVSSSQPVSLPTDRLGLTAVLLLNIRNLLKKANIVGPLNDKQLYKKGSLVNQRFVPEKNVVHFFYFTQSCCMLHEESGVTETTGFRQVVPATPVSLCSMHQDQKN